MREIYKKFSKAELKKLCEEGIFFEASNCAIDLELEKPCKIAVETVYLLFETDEWKSTASRVFLGAFSSRERAEEEALKNNLKTYQIIDPEIDEFYEI